MKNNTDEQLKQWLGKDNQIGIDIWHTRESSLLRRLERGREIGL